MLRSFRQILCRSRPGGGHRFAFDIHGLQAQRRVDHRHVGPGADLQPTARRFSEVIGRSQSVFLEHANLIKKLSFPRICLPLIVVLNAGINFVIIFALFLGFLLATQNFPGWAVLGVIPVLLIQIAFSIGLGIILGVLNVFFRDVGQFMGIFLQFWFWFTPLVYPLSILPEGIRPLINANPIVPLIAAYQGIFVYGQWPDWSTLWPTALLAVALCLLAMRLFRKRSGEMVDEL